MKKVTVANYKSDPRYPRVVRAVEGILDRGRVVSPVDVFIHLDLLSKEDLSRWRSGKTPYLEKVIRCNLSKANRILRILGMVAHDLNLRPSNSVYVKWGKGRREPLHFSKTGISSMERIFSRHYLAGMPKTS